MKWGRTEPKEWPLLVMLQVDARALWCGQTLQEMSGSLAGRALIQLVLREILTIYRNTGDSRDITGSVEGSWTLHCWSFEKIVSWAGAKARENITFLQGDGLDFIRYNTHRPDKAFFIDQPYTVAK